MTGLGRVAAVLVLGSVVVHLLQVTSSSLASLAMAGMALACLPCAWHLCRAATPSVWALTGAVDVGMLLLHGTFLAGSPHAAHGAAFGTSGLTWLGTWLVTGQLLIAGAAMWRSWGAGHRKGLTAR
ncbi:hypothetical protein ACI8AF_18055 [Blastococcus sp. SYSU D00669]